MPYLHVEWLDGRKETHYVEDSLAVKCRDGVLYRHGGDGSYRERGTSQGWPLAHIRGWRVNEEPE